jgi:uncharacterized OB-fold protein
MSINENGNSAVNSIGQSGEYLGMQLRVDASDHENLAYFQYCADHDFHLQFCTSCTLFRYPPTTACPWCGHPDSVWKPVEGKGTIYSYAEVHHAIQPAFKDNLPYQILIVELDTQKGKPEPDDGIRIAGNLVTPDSRLASPEMVASVGIGSRVRMVFKPVSDGFAVPLWTIDESAEQPGRPWRYPE